MCDERGRRWGAGGQVAGGLARGGAGATDLSMSLNQSVAFHFVLLFQSFSIVLFSVRFVSFRGRPSQRFVSF